MTPKVNWYTSPTTEAVRLLFECKQIKEYLTQNHNMHVTDKLYASNASTIFIPRLKIFNSKGFWQKIPSTYFKVIKNNTHPLVSQIEKEIDQKSPNYKELRNEFKKSFEFVWKDISQTIPELVKDIKIIEIYPSSYGAISTEYSSFLKNNSLVRIIVREDASVANIYEMIVSERITRLTKHSNNWYSKESLIDFLLTKTKLSKHFEQYYPTIKSIENNQHGELVKKSFEYFNELGFPIKSSLNIYENKIYIKEKILPLRDNQFEILKLLLENKNKLITHEQIADKIWRDESSERYSLYAITKTIQRIRNRLKEEGLNKNVIHTCKGKGYILTD